MKGGRDVELIKCLLGRGAEVNLKDDSGHTPLHLAVKGGRDVELIKYLLDHGAEVIKVAEPHSIDYIGLVAIREDSLLKIITLHDLSITLMKELSTGVELTFNQWLLRAKLIQYVDLYVQDYKKTRGCCQVLLDLCKEGLIENYKKCLHTILEGICKTTPKGSKSCWGKGSEVILSHEEISNINLFLKALPVPTKVTDAIASVVDSLRIEADKESGKGLAPDASARSKEGSTEEKPNPTGGGGGPDIACDVENGTPKESPCSIMGDGSGPAYNIENGFYADHLPCAVPVGECTASGL